MNDTRRRDPRREACDELAEHLARPEGYRGLRLLELAGFLERPPETSAPAEESAPPEPETGPRPIGIWRPRTDGGELIFERPEPGPWGDHWAARRRIAAHKKPGVRRICFFGESAAAGYLYAPHATPALLLENRLGERFEVVDLARTNETLAGLVEKVDAALQLEPDLVVLFAGNNWNLLETPEISPYAPGVGARQRFGQALRKGGVRAAVTLARRRLAEKARRALGRIAELTRGAGARVIAVLPEVDLADWENRQLPTWLPGDGNARWFELYREAQDALRAGQAKRGLELAGEMLELDGGLCPSTHRLRALALGALGHGPESTEACRDEVDAAAYASLCFLGAPQATRQVRELLAEAAKTHGWGVVDLARVFGSPEAPPGRRFFVDYCHLSLEGMELAAEALAAEIGQSSEIEPFELAPEAEATARLGAAVHGAHRLLSVGGAKAEILEFWCRRALEASPGIRDAMLDLVAARAVPLPAVLSAAQARNFASPYRLTPQHGWRWAFLDAELIQAIARALENTSTSEEIERLLIEHLAVSPEGVELTRAPFLWEPLERFYPEAMDVDAHPRRAQLRSPWPETAFALVVREDGPLTLELTARLPAIPGLDVEREGEVRVELDGEELARVAVGGAWSRSAIGLAVSRGLHRVSLHWPPPPPVGGEALAAAARRLEEGLEADLHPVWGEIYSLRASTAAGSTSTASRSGRSSQPG